MSCDFLPFPWTWPIGRISADIDLVEVLPSQTHMLKQDTWWSKTHGGHMMFGGSINGTQRTVREACLHSYLCKTSWSHVSPDLWFIERSTVKNLSWCSWWSWLLLLTCANLAEAWLSLLGHATTADSCLLYWHYWTGMLVYSWSICKWIELPLLNPVNWTADFLTMQMGFAPKNNF